MPAALLFVAQAPAGLAATSSVVTLDADSVADGPLSVADAIEKALESGRPADATRRPG